MIVSHKAKHYSHSGFSILEVIIFTTLISIALVASAGFTTQLLRNMSINQNKIMATHFIDSISEFLNWHRLDDWIVFEARAGIGAGFIYCYTATNYANASFDQAAVASIDNCPYETIAGFPTPFRGAIVMQKTSNQANGVTARIEVSWLQDGVVQSQSINRSYSVWQ